MPKKVLTLVGSGSILILSVLLMFAFIAMKKDPDKRKPFIPVRNVKAVKVSYSNTVTSFRASGRVNSREEVVLSPEVGGKLLAGEIPFKKGQSFKKGDLLIKIYEDEAILQLKAKKSTFLKMSASILPDFRLSFPESYEKWLDFFENIDLNADFPELPEMNSGQEKVFLASRGLLSDYYSVKSDELRLKKHNIYAPFNGAITEVSMEVGAFVNTGSRIANIINTQELEVEVPVAVDDAKWLNKGDNVNLHSEDFNQHWNGKILRKAKDVDENTQSISVFVELLSGNGNKVYKGQYLIAEFSGIELKSVMGLPRSAVFNSNEVFIVKDSLLQKSEINIQKITQDKIFFNGLDEGLSVVSEPLINANENTKVRILR